MASRVRRTLIAWVALVMAVGAALAGTPAAAAGTSECVNVTDVRGKRLYLGRPTADQRAAADELERWVARHADQVAGSDWCSTQTALQVWVLPGALLDNEIADLADQTGVPIAISSGPRSARELQAALAHAVATLNETELGIARLAINPGAGGLDVEVRSEADQSNVVRAQQIAAAVSVPVIIHLIAAREGTTPTPEPEAPLSVGPGCPLVRDQLGQPWYPKQVPDGLVALSKELDEVARQFPVEVVTVARCSTLSGVQVWLTQRAGDRVRAAITQVAVRHPQMEVVVTVASAAGSAEQLWPGDPTPLTMVGLVGFDRDPTRLVAVAWLDLDSPDLLAQATQLADQWNRSVPLEVRAVRLTDGPVIKAVPAPPSEAPTQAGAPAPVDSIPTGPVAALSTRPKPPTWLIATLVALGWLGLLRLAGLGVRVQPTTEVEASEELNALETWRLGFEDVDED